MSEGQSEKEFEFLIRTNDLENIGDLVDKNLLELVRKTSEKGYSFSSDGWRELLLYHAKVLECLRLSSAYFGFRDPGLKNTVLALHRVINGLYLELSELHVHRLHQGVKASLETTAVHLDVLGYLKRVSDISVGFIRLELDTERQDSA
jgi:phosphate:Na+ symporter